MSPLLADAEFGPIREALGIFLVHRYTRTPVTAGSVTTWNEQTSVPGTPVSGQPCQFAWQDRFVRTPEGATTVSTPTLTVAWDDPLKVGDWVSTIVDQTGAVLLAGPAAVETVNPQAELGASLQKLVTLRAADVRAG